MGWNCWKKKNTRRKSGSGNPRAVAKKGAQRCATSIGKATEHVAKLVGCSDRLIGQIQQVQAKSPALLPEIAAGNLTVGAALKRQGSPRLSKTLTPPSVCYWIWMTLTNAGYAPAENQRHCIGIDLNPEYLRIAKQKLAGAKITTL